MNKFLFKTKDKISKKESKELVGKHIHFTWYNKEDDVMETIPGLVLDNNDGLLSIYTMDIIFDNATEEDNNRFIKDINYDELSNILVFDNYTKEFWKLLDNLDDKDIINKEFDIKNIFGDTITTKIVDYNIPLSISILIDKDEVVYPLYFIESINNIK